MKKKTIRALELGLAVMLIVSLVMVIRTQTDYSGGTAAQEEAAELVGLPTQLQSQPADAVEEEELDPNLLLLAEIDLESLREENPDIIGWLCIPDTELSYPLLQGTDNSYYLNHTWRGAKNSVGSIFMDYAFHADFSDFHTLIYGHRMNNDSMFGTLKYYKDLDFWQEHPSVYVASMDSVYRYDIFSSRKASVEGVVYRLDIEENHLEEELIQDCIDASVIDTGLSPNTETKILTLSTCTGKGYATRWVVHAFLTQSCERDKAILQNNRT